MNRLERLMWNTRGKAARIVVEQYDGTASALFFPVVAWAVAGGLAYALAGSFTINGIVSVGGLAVTFAIAVAFALFLRAAVTATLATKYYVSEWTADVRPPEVSR